MRSGAGSIESSWSTQSRQCWFNRDQFIAELERQGVLVGDTVLERFFGDFIVGVGHRPRTNEN